MGNCARSAFLSSSNEDGGRGATGCARDAVLNCVALGRRMSSIARADRLSRDRAFLAWQVFTDGYTALKERALSAGR